MVALLRANELFYLKLDGGRVRVVGVEKKGRINRRVRIALEAAGA